MIVLVLGGTGEARELAAALHARGDRVVSSLAGRVSNPQLPPGEVRIGGFGGVQGLEAWLRRHGARAVIDATHPFARHMSANAVVACAQAGVPLLRLERPVWEQGPGDRWHRVPDLPAAAAALAGLGERVLLTTGRQGLEAFATSPQWFLIRCVDPPQGPLPARHELLLDRGPFTVEGDGALLDRHRIDVVVTKESGGEMTRAKLVAARERGLPVVVVARPPHPGAVPAVSGVADALRWLDAHPG